MSKGNPIILKVIYNDIKLKFQAPDDNETIQDLKQQISILFNEQGIIIEPEQIDCLDSDDFKMSNNDKISALLRNNDLIKIFVKKPDHLVQKDQQLQQNPLQQQQQMNQNDLVADDPLEAIVVLFDTSGSMSTQFFQEDKLTRMGAVNAFFSAFADKTLAFEFPHIVKLVQFNTRFVDKCEFTNDFNNFITLVDGCNPGGSTLLFDSIQYSIEQLLKIKSKYPSIILRILALTDGEDNGSKSKPQDLVQSIISNKIIIDSFVVSQNCTGLKTLTHASGGRCYCPQEISQGLDLFELETILSVSQRENKITDNISAEEIHLEDFKMRPFDTEGMKAAKPKAATEAAMKREDIIKQYLAQQQEGKSNTKAQVVGTVGGAASKRIYKELNDILTQGKELPFKAFPTNDIFNWRIIILGPKGTVYENGKYSLTCIFPQDYPFKPPKMAFMNKIYHCNINRNGAICIDILKDHWSPAITISKVCYSISTLLENPNTDDALDSIIASVYKHEPQQFKINAINETKLYANLSGVELAKISLGDGADQNGVQFKDTLKEIEEWIAYHQ